MSPIELAADQTASARPSGLTGWVKHHPLLTLFALVYQFEWIILVPMALASQGLFP